MNELTKADLHFVVSHIPKDLRELFKKQKLLVGGGFIRELISGGKIQDIDVFGESEEALATIAEELKYLREGSRVYKTKNAITLLTPERLPVQFITRWVFTDAESLIQSFDFTVCKVAVWYDQTEKAWKSITHEGFYSDLAAKRLVYTYPKRDEEAGGSLLRARKFLQRGYNIQVDGLAGIIARLIMAVGVQKAMALGQDPEHGVATVLAGLLREVDPLHVIDGIDMVDETDVL